MDIPYRSPNNIIVENLDDAVSRPATGGSSFCARKWVTLSEDCKSVLKMVINGGYPYKPTIAIFCMGLQVGFDLHAKFGDSGNAELYAEKPKEEEKKNGN